MTLARQQIGSEIAFDAGPPPVAALRGVGAGGRVEPETPAEIVVKRLPIPLALVVRARVRGGAAPRLSLRHALGGAAADPERAAGATDRDQFVWTFDPPAARSPIDYTALEFTCLPPEDGSRGAAIELEEIRYTVAPESPGNE